MFQFLYQGYDAASQTRESLAVLVSGTFLADTTYDTDLDTSNGVNTYAKRSIPPERTAASARTFLRR